MDGQIDRNENDEGFVLLFDFFLTLAPLSAFGERFIKYIRFIKFMRFSFQTFTA
jgi:hypothetical protein